MYTRKSFFVASFDALYQSAILFFVNYLVSTSLVTMDTKLIHLLKHVLLFHNFATFKHLWSNTLQFTDGTEHILDCLLYFEGIKRVMKVLKFFLPPLGIGEHYVYPCPGFPLANHMKFIHMVGDNKRKVKLDFTLYNLFLSWVMPIFTLSGRGDINVLFTYHSTFLMKYSCHSSRRVKIPTWCVGRLCINILSIDNGCR